MRKERDCVQYSPHAKPVSNQWINRVLMRVMDAVKETIADVSSARAKPFVIRSDEGLHLETPAIVSFTASITLINTPLIHHFVSRNSADAVTLFS